jgi:protocatechuate 3,4-dioxygenase beta subunit
MDKRLALAMLAALLLAVVAGTLLIGPAAAPRADGRSEAAVPAVAPANAATATAPADAPAGGGTQRDAVTPAEETVDPDAATATLAVHVTFADGTAAPDVGLYVQFASPDRWGPVASRVSNANGDVETPVPAGPLRLTSDRGGSQDVTVAPRERKQVAFVLEAGVEVEGIVRDADQRAAGDAAIWLTTFASPWCSGRVVAHSAADGTFRVRAVPKDQSLGALAPGHAPSALVDLDLLDTKTSPVHVELVLGGAGAELSGRVADTRGKAVADAMVAVGDSSRRHNMRTSGSTIEQWGPRVVRTDRDGNYRCEGLAPGHTAVEVWAEPFPFWHGACDLVAGAATTLDVELQDGVVVHGTVSGEDGKPLAGAVVRGFPAAVPATFLQFGQYDYESTFGYRSAVADATGRYRLLRLLPGEQHLYASAGANPDRRRRGMETRPWAETVLAGAPGADLEWNPKVEPGPTIAGVVRHHDGVPMANVFVNLGDPAGRARQAMTTDQQGRFRFVHLQNHGYDLSVQYWSAPKDTKPLEARDVWPDRGEVVLEAPFDSPKKAVPGSVRGVVVDAGHRLGSSGALAVTLALDDRSWRTNPTLDGNAFTFDDVEPGRHQIVVMSGEDPILSSEWFDLQPAEKKDLGVLQTEPGGALRLHLQRTPGTEQVALTAWVTQEGAMHGRKVDLGTDSERTVDNLTAGKYRLGIYANGATPVEGHATVAAGSVADLTLRLTAAVVRELAIEYPAEATLRRAWVRDASGASVVDHAASHGYAIPRPFTWKPQLPLGQFTLIAEFEGGRSAEVAFAMATLAVDQPAVRLVVP